MMPWFIWNNKNSSDMGLWISRLPKITRPKERYSTIDIPGRAGSLIMLEGDDIYESYVREIQVTTRRDNPRMQEIMDWLRGDGELIVCNETNRAYHGRIAAELAFDKLSNDLMQAKVAVFVEPFKTNRYQDKDVLTITTGSATIHNPGNVSGVPTVSITGTGNNMITIAGESMTFSEISGTILVDCGARIISQSGEIWTGSFTGEFWNLPVGEIEITQTGSMTITINPGWRWV